MEYKSLKNNEKIARLIGSVTLLLGLVSDMSFALAPQQPTGFDKFNKRSELFSARADGRELFVEHFKAIHYVNFAVAGPTRIETSCTGNIENFRISPMSLGIEGTRQGDKVSFTIPGQDWYVL